VTLIFSKPASWSKTGKDELKQKKEDGETELGKIMEKAETLATSYSACIWLLWQPQLSNRTTPAL